MEPAVLALERKYAGKVEFVIVDIDTPDGRQLADQYDVYYIPAFFFMDRAGKVAGSETGYFRQEGLEDIIDKLL